MFCFDTNTCMCSWVKLNAYVYVLLWHKHIRVLLSQTEHLCLCSALTQTHMCAPESNWTLMFMFCFDTNTHMCAPESNWTLMFMFRFDTNTYVCSWVKLNAYVYVLLWHKHTYMRSWVKLNAYVYVLLWHKHTYMRSWVKLNAYVYVLLWHKHTCVLLSQIERLCLCSALTQTHMCAPESNWTLMFMFRFDTNTYVCSWVKLNAYVYVLLWHKHIRVLLSQIEHLCLCSALTQTHMCAPESNWTLMFMFCFDTNT